MNYNKPTARKNSIFLIPRHWRMLVRATLGDLKSRYAGSLLGIGWSILTPFVLLSIYSVIYLVVFKVRAPNLTPVKYVLLIFSGLVPFIMTNESINSAVNSIVANKAILANTVFPVDLLPVKSVFSSQITMFVGMSAIVITLIVTRDISWTVLLLPFIWLFHILAIVGLVWILSLANLAVRDISDIITLGMVAVMVMTPIAYTREMVPAQLKLVMFINPLAYFVLAYQDILVRSKVPDLGIIAFIIVFSASLFLLGGWLFYRMKQVMLEYA
ncbi:MAG TPA: ABC transporter permease [Anaerolineales bacterium]|nr:ABC transporter permease [Anaerolineales bacterium]